MVADERSKIEIAGYLRALNEQERIYQTGATPGERLYKRIRNLALLRVNELYWTLSRLLGSARQRLFPGYRARMNSRPAWASHRPETSPQAPPPSGPRLLLDMTSTLRSGKATGIQRVVREIARNAWEAGAGIPVAIHDGKLYAYYRHPEVPDIVDIEDGDVFLMLDATWNHTDEYPPILEVVKARRGRCVVCLYDILPLLYPNAFPPVLTGWFRDWLERIVLPSDGVVADSRAAAESLRDYLSANNFSRPGFPLGWWRLGADFSVASTGEPSEQAAQIAGGRRPYFLGVGTVEPRKGYALVLDALDRLWGEGLDFAYVIVGGRGWSMGHFENRLRRHPEFGRRLFWLQRAGDADLSLLYAHARALALASVAEGFGLPIVEAANYGAPVIATDIPVFREVAGDSARYFALLDADSLAAQLREALIEKPSPPVIDRLSWRDSTAQLIGIVRDNAFQTRLE